VPEPRFAADAAATAHVFATTLADEVNIAGTDGHHLARARRLRPGERVTVADGDGEWRPYTVAVATDDGLSLSATGPIAREPVLTPRLVLAFALTKSEKPEVAVQKVTELGADAVQPVLSCRTVRRAVDATRTARMTDRLRRVAREAAMQCRRARLPDVSEPVPLSSLAGRPGLVVAARGGGAPDELAAPTGGEWVLIVGPEGGLDAAELEALDHPPRLAVGPHVLRAETAAIAATAALAVRRRPA
jgi:16S rRNA (uracil1498-N3)-methyltransferase